MPTTWNISDKTGSITLSNANLTATVTSLGNQAVRTVANQSSGKSYWEYTFTNTTNDTCGIAASTAVLANLGVTSGNSVLASFVNSSGQICTNGVGGSGLGAFSTNGIVCVALDFDNKFIWFRSGAAGNWNANIANNPATGVGGISISFVGGAVSAYGLMSANNGTNGAITANFGASGFVGVVPSGFTSGFPATGGAAVTQAMVMVLA